MAVAKRLLKAAAVVVAAEHCGECCNFHPLDLEKEENKSIKLKSAGKLLKCYVKSSIITQMK